MLKTVKAEELVRINAPNLYFECDTVCNRDGFLSYCASLECGAAFLTLPAEDGKYPIYVELLCASLPEASPDYRDKTITLKICTDATNSATSDVVRAIEISRTNPAWDGRGLVLRGIGAGALRVMSLAEQIDGVSFLEILSPSFCEGSVCAATQHKKALTYPVYICAPQKECNVHDATSLYSAFRGIKALDVPQGDRTLRLRHDPKNPSGELKTGRYRHYKGGEYEVIGIAHDSETLEDTVVYRSLKDGDMWVRAKWMFEEYANVRGIATKRFEYIN